MRTDNSKDPSTERSSPVDLNSPYWSGYKAPPPGSISGAGWTGLAGGYTLPYPGAPHDGGAQDQANTAAIVNQLETYNRQQYASANQPTFLDKLALMTNVSAATAGIGGAIAPAVSGAVGGGTAGAVAGGAATGAAGGVIQSALTGQNLGRNVLTGAATGAFGGALKAATPAISGATGIPAPAITALGKGATGALTGGLPGAVAGATGSLITSGLQEEGAPSSLAKAGGSYLGSELGQQFSSQSTSRGTSVMPYTMQAGGPGGDPSMQAGTGAGVSSGGGPDLSGVNSTTGLAGVGSGISSGLSNLGIPSGLSSALPYLAAGGLGLYQSSQASKQNQGNVNTLSGYGAPYTAAGTALLNQGMSGQLTPQQSNVVQTLTNQGQTLIDSAAPLSNIANTAFANYQAGQLNPGQQQQIDAWTTSAKQQLQQTLAQSGISDSSILASQGAAIDSQATQLKANLMAQNLNVGDQQYAQWLTSTQAGQKLQADGAQYAVNSINTMLQQALQLGQVGMQQQSDAIKTGIQQDQQLSANVGNLFKSLAGAYAVANKPAGAGGGGGGGAVGSGSASDPYSQDPAAAARLYGGTGDTISSQYGSPDLGTGPQALTADQLQTPAMGDITAGTSMPNFDTSGYDVTAGNNIDSSTFNGSFFDPGMTDLPSIDFGGG